ncbi:MAG: Eco57I restriction-modification methylase domain-containing protein [Acidimicrobiia bacterium]
MLTYAFDLLFKIYEEEGYSPTEIPSLILENNLFGAELDDRAGSLAAFALSMKARAKQNNFFNQTVKPNICVLKPIKFSQDELDELTSSEVAREDEQQFWNQFEHADLFGSLILPNEELLPVLKTHLENNVKDTLSGAKTKAEQVIAQAEYLTQRYHVVVANPPYMGKKTVVPLFSDYIDSNFPDSKSDLFSAFISRGLGLSVVKGYSGLVNMQSWMFLKSYEKLRNMITSEKRIVSMIHLGTNAFDSIGGDVVSTTAFVLENLADADKFGLYIRAVDGESEAEKKAYILESLNSTNLPHIYKVKTKSFKSIPGSPIAYWLEPVHVRGVFERSIATRNRFASSGSCYWRQ